MSWECRTLAEVADFNLGKMLDQRKNRGALRPYLANVNVRWGEFELDNLREMRFEDHELDRYGLRAGDIVMCEGGEPGRCAIWNDQLPGMMFQKALHRIRPHSCLDHSFLYYSFLQKGRMDGFGGLFTGSTIKHLPKEKLAKIEVRFPPLPEQQRIATILSAYDELIENNRRRIVLLEDAARQLYKEWFVRLRFPGHEHVKVIEGVPEGWRRHKITDVWDIAYGKNLPTSKITESGAFPVHGADGIIGYFSEKNVDQRLCLITSRGAGSGNVRRTFGPTFVTNNCLTVKPKMKSDVIKFHFAIHAMMELRIQDLRTGAAQPQITLAGIGHVLALVPSNSVLQSYNAEVDPIIDLADLTRLQNDKLAQARDLLLPKLMNGTLTV